MHGFLHVILTRFNVPTPGREAQLRAAKGWLADRFEIFREVCFPSLQAQTCRDFIWLIYFDKETAEPFRAQIDDFAAALDAFTPIYCASAAEIDVVRDIASQAPEGADWLVTTRLDNDDALNPDFVRRLHEAVTPGQTEALNFTSGLILSNGRFYRHRDRSGAFISLSEPMAGARTVWAQMHPYMSRLAPVRQLALAPAWLQLVHGANVSNKLRGLRVDKSSARLSFPFLNVPHVDDLPESATERLADNFFRAPGRLARGGMLKLLLYFREILSRGG